MFKSIIVFIPFILNAGYDNISNGFGLDIGSNGSGLFIVRQYSNNNKAFAFNFEMRFYDIKSQNETIVYDYYTRQYKAVSGKSLFMTPLFAGVNFYPFMGKIDNSFSPFLTTRFGPVLIIDGEDEGDFSERWSKPTFKSSIGSFFGLGIDFKYIQKSYISTIFGYEILPPDPSENKALRHSGILIHISFNRNLR
jgi:hypothetical protein